MTKDKGHERLQDCRCSWSAEPIEINYEHESQFMWGSGLWDEKMATSLYTRAIVHHINPGCKVHAWLLNPVGYGVGKPLPKVSSIAVDAVPLANGPWITAPGKVREAKMPPAEMTNQRDAVTGVETPVEGGGMVSRRTLEAWPSVMGRAMRGEVTDAEREALVERAKGVWKEFMHEYGDKMQWVVDYAKAQTTSERERIKYEARKRSDWYFAPLEAGGGMHCRSCHHDCRYEAHIDAQGQRLTCQEPSCGHWMGCPSC